MLSGSYTPRMIWEIATDSWGLRTVRRKRIGGKSISLSAMYRVLTNPFYAGVLEREGKTYPGKHPPMVTLEEFEHVQALLGRPGRPRETRTFAYTGMIRCGECGFSVTAEEKINRQGHRYTYYHCSKRRLRLHCNQLYVQLPELERQIVAFLEEISLPDRFHRWTTARLEREFREHKVDRDTQKQSLTRAEAAVARELENLTKLRIRDLLSDEEFVSQRQSLERQQLAVRQQLHNHEMSNSWFEPAKALISLNNSLVSSFAVGDIHKKRLILNSVGSNLVLMDQKLRTDVRKPFRRWEKDARFSDLRAFVRDVRTFVSEQTPSMLQLIAAAKEIMSPVAKSDGMKDEVSYEPIKGTDSWQGPGIAY